MWTSSPLAKELCQGSYPYDDFAKFLTGLVCMLRKSHFPGQPSAVPLLAFNTTITTKIMKLHLPTLLLALFFPLSSHAAVEAFEVGPESTSELPKGKEADGISGDYILRNGHITAVIAGNLPNRRANMGTFYGSNGITPGCLYDLTLNDRQNDQLTVFSPNQQKGQISYMRITAAGGDGKDSFAEIEVVVDSPRNDGVYKQHTYRIDGEARGILVTSTYRNDSKSVKKVQIGDYWKPSGDKGSFHKVAWIDSVDPADRCGYASAWLEKPERQGGIVWQPKDLELEPGQTQVVSRYVAVGNSPAHACSEVLSYAEEGLGNVKIQLSELIGNAPVAAAKLDIKYRNANMPAYTLPDGKIALRLPEGKYTLSVNETGREKLEVTAELAKDGGYSMNGTLSPLSGVHFKITGPDGQDTPCKVQFAGIDGTKTPNLGPQNRAHGCVDQWHSETGTFKVALDPGKYRLVITRGIEHSSLVQEVEVKAGEFSAVNGKLERPVESKGWVSTDFHNHSTPSGDNQCGTDDRIINLAAEHIEFAPTTEHNRIYNWAPHIKKLGLEKHLSTIVGMELTGRGAGSHHNAFPLPGPFPYEQDGGAPAFQEDPRHNAIALQNFGGWDEGQHEERWVHINHPNLAEKFWDRNLDGHADGGFIGYEKLIDAIESQNFRGNDILATAPWKLHRTGPKESLVEVREFVWLQMLNQGMRTRAIAVADAHSVYGNGVGGWRTYVASSTDDPAKVNPAEIIHNAKHGMLMLTTGPFLEVKANGAIAGSDISAKSGKVKLKVKVQCTDWVDIDRVQVLVNGVQVPEYNFTRKANPCQFEDGIVKFDREIEVNLKGDAHLVVVAMGENHDLKGGYGTSTNARLQPCAYINPIWVDVDGKGFQPNMDTLGWPLPTGKQSVEKFKAMLKAKEKS